MSCSAHRHLAPALCACMPPDLHHEASTAAWKCPRLTDVTLLSALTRVLITLPCCRSDITKRLWKAENVASRPLQ